VAQRVGTGIALLFHDRGTRRRWVVSSTPWPQFTPGKDPVPILHEAPGSVWTGGKSRPHRDSIPDRPALVSGYTDWATRPTIQDGIFNYTRQKYSEFTSVIFITSCRCLYYSTRFFVPFFSSAVQLLFIEIGVKLILWFLSFQRRALYRFELLVSSAVACTSQEVTYELLVPFSSSSLRTSGSATSRHLHRFPCSLTGSCHLIVPLCFATMLTVLCDITFQFIN